MFTASCFLVCIGLLGAVDIAWFHAWKGQLTRRVETRAEAFLHVARGFVYALQFVVVPGVRFEGSWFWALTALFVIDAGIAVADVLLEPASRASQGGLKPGEYLMHIVLSVLVGGLLHSVFDAAWGAWAHSTRLAAREEVPSWLRTVLLCMAVGAALVSLGEAASLWEASWGRPSPIHVRVRLVTTVERLWALTQNHLLHPSWDHRFSRIELLAPTVSTGALMRYEKDLGPFTIRGFGRYVLHRPRSQSTFEFWSDDWRSLIRRGVGLWRYTQVADGRVEFSTSYTYEVRWGLLGRMVDRFLFRPAFQWYTEASFARLAREHFADGASQVLGAVRGAPERFVEG